MVRFRGDELPDRDRERYLTLVRGVAREAVAIEEVFWWPRSNVTYVTFLTTGQESLLARLRWRHPRLVPESRDATEDAGRV